MYLARFVSGVLLMLTNERIAHIMFNHPEVIGQIPWIIETIEKPDLILSGDYSEIIAIKLFKKAPVTENKYLAVVFRENRDDDGYILTAYFCSNFNKRRKVLWMP